MSKFIINPEKICYEKHGNKNSSIVALNNCIVDTTEAFFGDYIPSKEKEFWTCAMEKKLAGWPGPTSMKPTLQTDTSDFPPGGFPWKIQKGVKWNNVTHYFPNALRKTQSKKKALKECYKHCQNNLDCNSACETDYGAVTEISPDLKKPHPPPPAHSPPPLHSPPPPPKNLSQPPPPQDNKSKKWCAPQWLIYLSGLILLIILLSIFFLEKRHP